MPDKVPQCCVELEHLRAELEEIKRSHSRPTNDDRDRLEIATQLYERFCADLVQRSDKARVRLISGIQVAIRDAAVGKRT